VRARRAALLAILSAALAIAVYPRFDAPWLAPVCLAPLLLAVAGDGCARRRFLAGWLAGVVYWFGLCYWIRNVLDAYGGLAGAGAWAVFLLFCLAKALHLAVFATLAGPLVARWYAIPAIAALWTGIERTHGPLGFAWLALGNAAVDMGAPLRVVPWTGVYGASFLLAAMNAGVALALLRRPRRELAWLAALPLLFALPAAPAAQPGVRSAAVVQPNLPMHAQWTEASMRAMHDRLARLSLDAALAGGQPQADLLLWPETPAPIYFETDPVFAARARQLAGLARTRFLFGTVAYTEEKSPLNSAQLLTPEGAPSGRYDKMRLVPFGEFVPPFFGFIQRITQEAGDFAPGRELVTFPSGEDRLGVFICYESAFPDHVRQFAARGATVLVNLTNDGYFGPTAAREQHLLLARMRAVENRRWVVRPANDGITASIDPAGRVVERFPEFAEHSGRLRYSPIVETTFYTRHGDWFAWLCLAAGLAAAARELVPAYRRPAI
jgi:apolipoprotein N-acyltransferase